MPMFFSFALLWSDGAHYLRCGLAWFLFSLPGYLKFYGRRVHMPVSYQPVCLREASRKINARLLDDIYAMKGEVIEGSDNLWERFSASHVWREAMHSFVWLPHLAGVDDERSRHKMWMLITDWVEQNGQWSLPSWRSDIVGERFYYLLCFYQNITADMRADDMQRFHALLYQHYRHLRLTAHWEMRGARRIVAQVTLIIGMLCKSEQNRTLQRHLHKLTHELQRQIFADGGHYERSPETHFEILKWLCILHDLFVRDQRSVPEQISGVIDRMLPFLLMTRHADGHLYLFNGGGAGRRDEIERVLKMAARGRLPAALTSAPHSGFEAIRHKQLSLLTDVGSFPHHQSAHHIHAGTLSFELVMGNVPVVVNCGALDNYIDPYWHRMQKSTMAHSTISVGGYNASSLRPYGRRRALCRVERNAQSGHVLLTARHNGYLKPCRTIVERSLYSVKNEPKLVGEDKLIAKQSHNFQIRFHLHPKLKVELRQGHVLITGKDFSCQFFYEGAEAGIEDSIYSPDHQTLYHNQQIVLSGKTLSQETVLRWSFKSLPLADTEDFG